ncbi:MAG: gliding motility-associated C-terminal domain-containing protein, partial [Fluviicola sp.]
TTDTDNDGLTDCEETTGIDDPSTPETPNGTSNPTDPCSPIGINTTDTDNDGLTDCEETTGIDDPSTPSVPDGTSNPNDACSPNSCADIEIPEGFSPDGNGDNDFFVIENLDQFPGSSIKIFNRWGTEVYSNENYDNTWDGTSTNSMNVGGDKLPTGTYYYIFDTKTEEFGVKTGFVYLKR